MSGRIQWKHKYPDSAPIVAYELNTGFWLLVGGTYKVKKELDKFGAIFNGKYWCTSYSGTVLPAGLEAYIDFKHYFKDPKPTLEQELEEQLNPVDLITPQIVEPAEDWRWKIRRLTRKQRAWLAVANIPKPSEVDNFVKPSYWDELLYYLSQPTTYPSIALVGPTGNGKTTTATASQEALSQSYSVMDMTEFKEPFDLVGGMTYHPEHGMVWVDGLFTKAFRNGWNIVINELDAANPRALMAIQSAFQDPGYDGQGRYITVDGHPDYDRVYPAGNCTIIATMNTYGSGATRHFTSRNALDASQLNRFQIISTEYENEDKILIAKGFKRETAKDLLRWAKRTRDAIDRNALRLVVSPRDLMRMANVMEIRGLSLQEAVDTQFLSRVDPEDRNLLK